MNNTIKVDHPEQLPDALSIFDKNDEIYAGVKAIKQVTKVFDVYREIEDYGDLVSAAISDLSAEGKVAVLNLYNLTDLRKSLILLDTGMTLSEIESVMYKTESK